MESFLVTRDAIVALVTPARVESLTGAVCVEYLVHMEGHARNDGPETFDLSGILERVGMAATAAKTRRQTAALVVLGLVLECACLAAMYIANCEPGSLYEKSRRAGMRTRTVAAVSFLQVRGKARPHLCLACLA